MPKVVPVPALLSLVRCPRVLMVIGVAPEGRSSSTMVSGAGRTAAVAEPESVV